MCTVTLPAAPRSVHMNERSGRKESVDTLLPSDYDTSRLRTIHRRPSEPTGDPLAKNDVEELKIPLLDGNEYYDTFSSPAEWLASLYPNILEGRTGDAAGLAYWEGVLGSNPSVATRTQVVTAFVHSPEEMLFWVNCSYEAGLGREGDSAGITYWTNWLKGAGNFSTQGMWAYFLATPEAQAYAATQPQPASA